MREAEEADEVYMALSGGAIPGGLPPSPRGPKALIWSNEHHPELGPIQRSFFSFDTDCSGAVSAVEVPRMLKLLGIGPRSDNLDTWRKYDMKWKDALASIYPPKEPTDLICVADFHDLCLELKPGLERELPERKRPQEDGLSPSEGGMLPSELAELERQRLEEERLRLEEEERARIAEEERARKATLHVQLPDRQVIQVKEVYRSDKVADLARRVEEASGHPVAKQRLICQGYEMNMAETLETYKVRTGHPQIDRGHTVVLLLRKPEAEPLPSERSILGTFTVHSSGGDGRQWQIMAKGDDAIGEVMIRLQEISGVPVNVQRLVGNGKELAPFERLRDCGLGPGDSCVMLLR